MLIIFLTSPFVYLLFGLASESDAHFLFLFARLLLPFHSCLLSAVSTCPLATLFSLLFLLSFFSFCSVWLLSATEHGSKSLSCYTTGLSPTAAQIRPHNMQQQIFRPKSYNEVYANFSYNLNLCDVFRLNWNSDF